VAWTPPDGKGWAGGGNEQRSIQLACKVHAHAEALAALQKRRGEAFTHASWSEWLEKYQTLDAEQGRRAADSTASEVAFGATAAAEEASEAAYAEATSMHGEVERLAARARAEDANATWWGQKAAWWQTKVRAAPVFARAVCLSLCRAPATSRPVVWHLLAEGLAEGRGVASAPRACVVRVHRLLRRGRRAKRRRRRRSMPMPERPRGWHARLHTRQ
jgi:hypothetical protein